MSVLPILGPTVAVILALWTYLRFRHRQWLEKQGIPYNRNSFHLRLLSGDSQIQIIDCFLKAGMRPGVQDTHGKIALVQAVTAGQIETVRLLLCRTGKLRHRLRRLLRRADADPNQPDGTGLRPLAAAVLMADPEIQKVLVEAGAEESAATGARLIAAVQNGIVKDVEHRISQGADLETRSLAGNTPVLEVASLPTGNPGVLSVLLGAGASIDARDERRRTALMHAAVSGNVGCAKVLLEANSDRAFLEAVDRDGVTAFALARRYKQTAIEKLLGEHGARPVGLEEQERRRAWEEKLDAWMRSLSPEALAEILRDPDFHPDSRDAGGRPLAAAAAAADLEDAVEELLDRGADPNLVDSEGETPLHAAAKTNSPKAARVLLERGARPDLRTAQGDTALHLASDSGSAEIVEELIRRKVNVNVRGRDDASALLRAVSRGRREVVERLLAAGADPDAGDRHGRTPLLVARLAGFEEIAGILTARGATRGDPEARLILAAERGDEQAVRELLAAGASARVLAGSRSALLGAAQRGRTAIVDLLLAADEAQRPDVNQSTARGFTPLMLAAARSRLGVVRSLLRARVKVNARRRDGGTALLDACDGRHLEVAAELLRHGARVDLPRRDGRSALMLAVERGSVEIARLVIECGADVNAVSRSGESPLMLALLVNDQPMIELLRRHGASTGQLEAELFLAAIAGNADRVRELVAQGAPVDAQARKWKVPLLIAVERGHADVVEALVEGRANVNDQSWRRTSPLMRAAHDGRLRIARYLLDHGATVDLHGPAGATPLMAACERGHTDTARALIKAGADVDARDDHGRTPLMLAILERHEGLNRLLRQEPHHATAGEAEAGLILATEAGLTSRALFFLQQQDANPNALGTRRRTALVAACERGDLTLVDALLDKEADPELAGPAGRTPLSAAAASSSVEIVGRLLDAGASPDAAGERGRTPLIVAAESGAWEAAARLMAAGANLNAADGDGETALMLAARRGHHDAVGLLLGAGAEIDARDKRQRTALMIAALADQTDVTRALLEAGASVDATDENNSTSLILASLAGRKAAVEVLLAAGADYNARDSFGNTPLMAAILQENFEVEDLLRRAGAEEGELEAKLLKAAERGDAAEVARLIAAGVNVNARRSGDDSALILACWADGGTGQAAASALLAQGADVKVEGRNGRTALMGAVRWFPESLLDRLMDKGACEVIEAVATEGEHGPLRTATVLAAEARRPEIVALLVERCEALRPDDPVFVTEHGDRYHRGRCAHVRVGSERPTLTEALGQNKRPCSVCLSRQ